MLCPSSMRSSMRCAFSSAGTPAATCRAADATRSATTTGRTGGSLAAGTARAVARCRTGNGLRLAAQGGRRSTALCAATDVETPLQVNFRKVDTFDLWLWLELDKAPSPDEQELIEIVFQSWYTLGRLGGFNSLNLQIFYAGDVATSSIKYNSEELADSGTSLFHELGELETRGRWSRIWVNMGTADEFALDILINALDTLSREEIRIRQLIIGGINSDWPVPVREKPDLDGLPPGLDTQDL